MSHDLLVKAVDRLPRRQQTDGRRVTHGFAVMLTRVLAAAYDRRFEPKLLRDISTLHLVEPNLRMDHGPLETELLHNWVDGLGPGSRWWKSPKDRRRR